MLKAITNIFYYIDITLGQCTPGEVFGDEALVFTKELVLQKEVRPSRKCLYALLDL